MATCESRFAENKVLRGECSPAVDGLILIADFLLAGAAYERANDGILVRPDSRRSAIEPQPGDAQPAPLLIWRVR